MVAALNGQFNDKIEHMFVIDCRYPYEFEGGHIRVSQLLPVCNHYYYRGGDLNVYILVY